MRQPAPFFVRHQQRLVEAAHSGPLVDLACGRGRNSLAASALGIPTIALDRNLSFLQELRQAATARKLAIQCIRSDLETSRGIPLRAGSCAAAMVFRFLYRPLCPHIEALLEPGGWLLYETFTTAQSQLPGGPNNPEFLLEPGELPKLFQGLEVHSFEETSNESEATAQLLARKPA